jgi:hypothetical protein
MATPNITLSKTSATADGIDKITLSGIPADAELKVTYLDSGEVLFEGVAGDTSVDLTFNEPGEYEASILVQSFVTDDGKAYSGGSVFGFLLEAT